MQSKQRPKQLDPIKRVKETGPFDSGSPLSFINSMWQPQPSEAKRKHQKKVTQIQKKLEYDIQEALKQTDYDERNILHRACLDQQIKQIKDIIEDLVAKKDDAALQECLVKQDKFHCQPLLLCCIKPKTLESDQIRMLCIQFLLNPCKEKPLIKADVNCFNPRTLWTCLHWAAYYGDKESVEVLLENNIHVFLPDYKGQYAVDLAGKNKYEEVVTLIIMRSIEILEYLKYGSQQKYKAYFESLTPDLLKHLNNPLFLCKLIYWSALYEVDSKNSTLLQFKRAYSFFPFKSLKMKTALHAACQSHKGNEEFLNEAFRVFEETLFGFSNDDLTKIIPHKKPTIQVNSVFVFSEEDLKKYRDEFQKEVLLLAEWEKEVLTKIKIIKNYTQQKQRQKYFNDFYAIYVNQQDAYGNSPLHVASIKAFKKGINILMEKQANMELENNEVFKARELTQDEDVLELYKEKLQSITSEAILNELNQTIIQQLMGIFKKDAYDDQLRLRNALAPLSKNGEAQYYKLITELNSYSQNLFVPDFIIRASIKAENLNSDTLETAPAFFDLKDQDCAELIRLNFYISLLLNANFEVYLMKSQFQQGFYYIMLQHNEKNLEDQADLMNLQMKLMDSYDLEEFEKVFQNLYEPFRSRQKQQIIEKHLTQIKDLNEQINSGIIETYYRMHKTGGINKIKERWLVNNKWYLPTPINQISEYLMEGENQNFSSITILRLYFGEKISFYFAWKSYITCALMVLAIPGAAIQIYILVTGDYFPSILPFWVCYVCLWSTLQVEFWKRKTSEITTRWGCLDLLDSKDKGEVRRGFQGYEEIYQVTGELTKHQKKTETFLKVVLSVLVVLIFLTLCVLIFVGVNLMVKRFEGQIIITTGLNIIQGVGIFILNLVYNHIVMFFAQYENHKYQEDYEQSIIYKNSAFTLLNSYLCIFYAAFVNNKSFLDLFIQLVPVLITKQVQFAALKVLLPRVQYDYYEKQYFKQQQLNIQRQGQLNRNKEGFKDKVETLYETIFKEKKYTIETCKRAVLKIHEKGKPPTLEMNLDADQVELNNLKLNYEGTLGYFMEGIIDLGYITLFAAAFPIGPAIAVVANVAEIRTKLISFLEVYKRPECQRCAGIGDWLNIMQWMGMGSVFSNFALLYVKYKVETVEVIYGYSGSDQDITIWLFFLTIAIILIIKLAFQWLIPDKPQWVLNELQNIQEKQHVNTGQREALKKTKVEIQKKQDRLSQRRKLYQEAKQNCTQKMQAKISTKLEKETKIERFLKQEESEKLLAKQGVIQKVTEIEIKPEIVTQIRIGLLRQKFIEIQHFLLQQRIRQIDQARTKNIFLCQECSLVEAVFDCEDCDESQCLECFRKVHTKMKNITTHEVMLLKSAKYYDHELLSRLQVKRKVKVDKKSNLEVKLNQQSQQEGEVKPRRWQKLQNFCFPITTSSLAYNSLPTIFNYLKREYLDNLNLERIELNNFYRFKREQEKFIMYESENINKILEMEELNLEEKLWLNRIGFLCFKKNAKFEHFYELVRKLQNSNLESKLKLVLDLADMDNDELITKHEIEAIFVPSIVQDCEGKFSLQSTIQNTFSKPLSKQKAMEVLLNQINSDEQFKEFFQQLTQCE
ncbi:unnamed protein product [Paramecium octaurelia]|uniref:B box-type domain-containing protein n=1 Tax=Paramecium octaurelia TaxID=43137 RepID=A0A8S1Y655_PAROT|nr:unnamed protein product [Paramecium octaurelia]